MPQLYRYSRNYHHYAFQGYGLQFFMRNMYYSFQIQCSLGVTLSIFLER